MNGNFTKEQKEKIIELLQNKGYILETYLNDGLTLSSTQIEYQLSQEIIDDMYLEITGYSNIKDNEYDDEGEENIKILINAYNNGVEGFSYIIFNLNIIDEEYAELVALFKVRIADFLINIAKNKKTITYSELNNFLVNVSGGDLSIFDKDKKVDTYNLIEDICRDLRGDNLLNLSALIITNEGIPGGGYFEIMKNRGVLKNNYLDMTLDEKKSFHSSDLKKIYEYYNY